MAKDQLKVGDAKYDTLVNTIYTYSDDNKVDLKIPPAVLVTFLAWLVVWRAKWLVAKVKSTATQLDRSDKNISRNKLTLFLRTFIKQWYYDNPDASPTDILGAGLAPRGVGDAPSTDIESPVVTANPVLGHIISLIVLNALGSFTKPLGTILTRVRYFLGATPSDDPTDYAKFKDFTKKPISLTFKPTDAGSDLAIAVCYVDKNADECTYCDIIYTKVP